jgi:hypothetical protein
MTYVALDFSGWTVEDFRYQSSREDWAYRLGVSSKTLQRYEKEILGLAKDRLPQALYWRDRRGRYKLDFYQKTILWIIQKLSSGEAYADRKLSYGEIQNWFSDIDEITNKKRILSITPPLVKKALGMV